MKLKIKKLGFCNWLQKLRKAEFCREDIRTTMKQIKEWEENQKERESADDLVNDWETK